MTEQVSKRYFVWSIAGGFGLSILLSIVAIIAAMSSYRTDKPAVVVMWLLLALIPTIYGVIIWLRLIYKMWQAIQDGHARVTPGTAVGFLFIPIFNLYWVFRAVACFPRDYNNFVDRHELNAQKLEPHMFVAFSAFCCAGNSAGLPLLIVGFILISRICDAINAISGPPPAKERELHDVGSHFRDDG
jgi:heme/copper-type cytochrome/quinol oxidase subunit 4